VREALERTRCDFQELDLSDDIGVAEMRFGHVEQRIVESWLGILGIHAAVGT
jgi:hypothetical protein